MAAEDFSDEDKRRLRKILTAKDALDYIKKALSYADIEEFETFDVHELPPILEKYDTDIDPLGPEDVRFIIGVVMDGFEAKQTKMARLEKAEWN